MTDVQSDGETVWLTQAQLAELFDTSKQNIFQECELGIVAKIEKGKA